MSGTTEILEEYLTKLGFVVDTVSLGKMQEALTVTEKRILKVGGAVASLVVAADAAVTEFAYSMRKMYFQSELSQSSVKNLKSLEYAGQQFGISAGAMDSAIHSMAQTLRLNPGLKGLVESFGIKVTGRDVSQVALDYVTALSKMPEYIGAQYAGLFGIDPDTYHQLVNHLDDIKKKQQENLEIYRQYGVDLDANKGKILEYTQQLDKMKTGFSALGDAILIWGVDPFKRFTAAVNEAMSGMSRWLGSDQGKEWSDWLSGKKVAPTFEGVHVSPKDKLSWETYKNVLKYDWNAYMGGEMPSEMKEKMGSQVAPSQLPKDLRPKPLRIPGGYDPDAPLPFISLPPPPENVGGIPPGVESPVTAPSGVMPESRAPVMTPESRSVHDLIQKLERSGEHAVSPKGAIGKNQITPGTALMYGFDPAKLQDPDYNDRVAYAIQADLIKQYGNDLDAILAAYNGGKGRADAFLKSGRDLSVLPRETQDYIKRSHKIQEGQGSPYDRVSDTRLGTTESRTVNVSYNTDIKVSGSEPRETAKAVGSEQRRVFGDVVRNLRGWAQA